MDAAFSWLGEFVRWLAAWVPRIGICRATHGGVKFVRGRHVKPIEPGLFLYWPAVTEVNVIPTARQTINPPPQTLTTKDDVAVLVNLAIVVEVTGVVRALGRTWDVDDTVMQIGGSVLTGHVARRTWAELRDGIADTAELAEEAGKLLQPYGVKVLQARVTDFARCDVVRVVGTGDGGVVPIRGNG